jgi:hypothetical protein
MTSGSVSGDITDDLRRQLEAAILERYDWTRIPGPIQSTLATIWPLVSAALLDLRRANDELDAENDRLQRAFSELAESKVAALAAARSETAEKAIEAVKRVDDGWTSKAERIAIAACVAAVERAVGVSGTEQP